MFIGHYAVALGAKRFSPQVSLGVLFLACQLADLIWPSLVQLGVESFTIEPGITAVTPLYFSHYPYSHSLIALVLWGVMFAGFYTLVQRAGNKAAMVIVLVVISHWVLDVLTHRADMPLTFDESILLGVGLWNFPALAAVSELFLFAAGVWIYTCHTVAVDRKGNIGFWALIIFLLGIYAANLLGPIPPSVEAVAWSAQAQWLIVAWGFWIDHHRENSNDG